MGTILTFTAPRQVGYEEYGERALQPGEVRLRTLYSGISAGTQLTAYRGTNPFVAKTWNPSLLLFEEKDETASFYPLRGGWAYEEVGVIDEVGVGVEAVALGQIVYGAWGHRSTHTVTEEYASQHLLPEGLDPLVGIYSQMGSIALNAILDAGIRVGETVVVYGQGVPGQIVTQLAKANGATVIAVDLDPYRLERSKRSGADVTLNSSNCDPAKEIKQLTDSRGADIVIEISGFTPALHQAIRSAAYNGRVVVSGFYQGEAQGLYLGEEFHHNRIQLICSQIGRVAPDISYRWDRLRMERTIMQLQQSGRINLLDLVTHVVPFEEAARAYDMLDRRTESSLQAVLKFS